MTYFQWIEQAKTQESQRYGQALMNTAPQHIYEFASGDLLLDCFHVPDVGRNGAHQAQIQRFVAFAHLVWDVTDEDQLKEARLVIWREM